MFCSSGKVSVCSLLYQKISKKAGYSLQVKRVGKLKNIMMKSIRLMNFQLWESATKIYCDHHLVAEQYTFLYWCKFCPLNSFSLWATGEALICIKELEILYLKYLALMNFLRFNYIFHLHYITGYLFPRKIILTQTYLKE